MKLRDKEILYCDNHLLVVDKPSLLLTLRTKEVEESVQTVGQAWIKERFQKPGNVFLHPVHRLDRVASGIVVCARTSKALSRLNAQIKMRAWHKRYKLRHEGKLPMAKGTLRHFLQKGDYHTVVGATGDEAILNYTEIKPGYAEVELITGRYHQIRAQFAAIGCPIRGDFKYGAQSPAISPGIDLHHTRLEFAHPVTSELLVINSIAPF